MRMGQSSPASRSPGAAPKIPGMRPCQALEVPLWRERSILDIGISTYQYIKMLPPTNKTYLFTAHRCWRRSIATPHRGKLTPRVHVEKPARPLKTRWSGGPSSCPAYNRYGTTSPLYGYYYVFSSDQSNMLS